MHPAPGFASLSRGDLQLLLNRPGAGGAGQAMPDGQVPASGGWNRIQIEVDDLEATVEKLRMHTDGSATHRGPATAASKSLSRIHPATRLSCSSRSRAITDARVRFYLSGFPAGLYKNDNVKCDWIRYQSFGFGLNARLGESGA